MAGWLATADDGRRREGGAVHRFSSPVVLWGGQGGRVQPLAGKQTHALGVGLAGLLRSGV